MDIASADRVLLLQLPPLDEVRSMAAAVTQGIVVGMLGREDVYEARAVLRDFANVMIAPAEDDGGIPWADDFFSVIYAPALAEPTPEILRVLAPGGTAWVASGPITKH